MSRNVFAVVFVSAAFFANPAGANNYYWNTTTSSTWITVTRWSDNSATGGLTGVVPGAADIATFNQTSINGTSTATLTADQAVLGLAFVNTGTTTIQSSNTTPWKMTIGASGITINPGTGTVNLGNAANIVNIVASGAGGSTQNWTNSGTSALNVLNGVTGNAASGISTIWFNGSATGGSILSGVVGNGTGGGILALKIGTGTDTVGTANTRLTLSGANTFSGGVTFVSNSTASTTGNGPTLNLNNTSALGTGTLLFDSGSTAVLADTSNVPIALSTNNAQTWNSGFAFTSTAGIGDLHMGSGNIAMNTSATLNVSTTNSTLTLGGVISQSAQTLTKSGNGMLVFSAANALNGDLALTVTGGIVTLSAANNFSGPTSVTGSLQLQNPGSVGSSVVTVNNGGTLRLRNDGSTTFAASGNNFSFASGAAATINVASTSGSFVSGRTLTVPNLTLPGNGGMVTFTNGNGYNFTSAGISTYADPGISGAQTIRNNMTGGTATLGGLTLNSNVTDQAFTFSGTSTTATTVIGAITQNGTSTASLAQSGTGTLILSGANTGITQGTSVSSGTVIAKNAAALGATTDVTVSSGASFNYAATADAPLVSTVTDTLTLSGGTSYTLGGSIGATTTSAAINFGGAASVTAASTIKVNVYGISGVTPAAGTNSYTLLSAASGVDSNTPALTLGTVYNSSNFTVGALGSSPTALTASITSATALTAEHWKGGLSGNTNVWAASNGSTASNWASDAGGTATSLTPGPTATVNFSATGASNQSNMVLGANMSILGLVSGDASPVTLNADGNVLTIGAGGITVNSGAGAVTLNASINLGGTQSWTNNSTNTLSVNSVVSGTGGLTKAGTGKLTLGGPNTYTGPTTISTGTLTATNGSALAGTSGVTLASGATFNYLATGSSPLSVPGTLAVTSGAGTTIGASIGSTATGAAITFTGTATTTAGAIAVYIYGIPGVAPLSGTNAYTLVSGTGASTLNNATYSLGTVYNPSNFTIGAISSTTTALQVSITSATALTSEFWKGGLAGNNNVWAASNGSTASNWASAAAGTATSLTPGSNATITFSATGATNQTNMVLGANMSVKGIVSNDTTAVTLNADGNVLTLGSGGITVNTGAAAVTLNAPIALSGSQVWTNNSANALTVAGALTGSTGTATNTLAFLGTAAGGTILSGAISDGTSAAVIVNVGLNASTTVTTKLTLSGNNTFSGGVNILGQNNTSNLNINSSTALGTGTLRFDNQSVGVLANTSGAAITLSTNNPQTWNSSFTFTSVAGTGDLNLGTGTASAGATRTVTVTNTGSTLTVGGPITGAGSLTKAGLGTLILGGASTYTNTNGTSIAAGTLKLMGGADRLPVGTTLKFTGTSTLDLDSNAQTVANITISDVASLTATIANGTLDLASGGIITFLGSSTTPQLLTGGTIRINTAATFDSTALGTNTGKTRTIASKITGTGDLTIKGAGQAPDGSNTNSAYFIMNNTANDFVGNIAVTQFFVNFPADGVFGNVSNSITISPNAGLILDGSGTITLPSSRSIIFTGGGDHYLRTQGGTLVINGNISETGGSAILHKTTGNTLTLNGTNTYTGSTIIGNGTLKIGTANSLPSGTTVIFRNSGGTAGLDVTGLQQTIAGMTFGTQTTPSTNNTITFTGNASSSLTITGGNLIFAPAGGAASKFTLTMAPGAATTLGAFTYNNTSGTFALQTGDILGAQAESVTMATTTAAVNTVNITAAAFNIGSVGGATGTGNTSTLTLGRTNTIFADTINIGNSPGASMGIVKGATAAQGGSLTIRGTFGGSADITIGKNGSPINDATLYASSLDAATNITSIDAQVGTLIIGNAVSDEVAGRQVKTSGTFKTAAGTMTVASAQIGIITGVTPLTSTDTYSATGLLSLSAGGTTNISTLTLGRDDLISLAGSSVTIDAQVTLAGTNGTTTLNASSISQGTVVAGETSRIARINWNDGTIGNITSGSLTISGVSLVLAGPTATHAFNISFAQTGTVSSVISGAGPISKLGDGTLVLTEANSYSGETVISAGTLRLSGGSDRLPTGTDVTLANATGAAFDLNNQNQTIKSLSGGGPIGGNVALGAGTLTVSGSSNTLYAGSISDSGGLTLQGNGMIKLSGSNTYAGVTTISGGTLIAANASALSGTSGVTVAAGAALNYSATASSPLAVSGTLAVTSGSGTTIGASIGSTANNAAMAFTGAATTTAGTVSVNVYGIPGVTPLSGTNTYTLVSGTGASTLNTATYTLGTVYNPSNFTVGALGSSATELTVSITSATALTSEYWLGATTSIWAASNGSTASGWASDAIGTATPLTPGPTATVIFSSIGASNQSSMNLGASMSITGLVSNDATAPVTLNMDTPANVLTLASGGVTVNTGAAAVTLNAPISLGAAQSWTTDSSNGLIVGGTVANNANLLTIAGAGPTTISGVVSGSGGLTMTGAGILTLAGANTYTGATTITAGTLKLSSGSNRLPTSTTLVFNGISTLDLNSQAQTVAAIALSDVEGLTATIANGTLALASGGTISFSGNTSSSVQLTGGTISIGGGTIDAFAVGSANGITRTVASKITGTGGLTLLGTGDMSDSGGGNTAMLLISNTANDFTGGVSITTGLVTANGNVFGNAANAITISTGAGLYTTTGLTLPTTRAIILSGNGDHFFRSPTGMTMTIGGIISESGGSANLRKTDAGTLVLSGVNTYTGNTIVAGGTLQATTLLNGASTTVGAGATLIVGGRPTTISQFTLTVNGNLRTDSNTNFNATFTPGTAGAVSLSGLGASAMSVGAAGNAKVGNVTLTNASGGVTISDGGNLTAGTITNSVVSNTGSLTNGKNAVTSANRIVLLGALALDGSVGNTSGKVTLNVSAQGQVPLATVEAAGLNTFTNQIGTLAINNDLAPINPPPVGGYTGAQRSYRASLDLNNNDLVINSATLADVTDMIRSGQNGTTTLSWDGNGLRSTYASTGPLAGLTGLGVMRNDDDPTDAAIGAAYYPSFSGISGLTGGEILVKYTWYGDFDLSGKVDAFDFALLDAGFTGTIQSDGYAGWFFGDANLDGRVDAFDFALLDAGFSGGGSTTSLPEPSTFILALLGVGTYFLARRGRLGRGSAG